MITPGRPENGGGDPAQSDRCALALGSSGQANLNLPAMRVASAEAPAATGAGDDGLGLGNTSK